MEKLSRKDSLPKHSNLYFFSFCTVLLKYLINMHWVDLREIWGCYWNVVASDNDKLTIIWIIDSLFSGSGFKFYVACVRAHLNAPIHSGNQQLIQIDISVFTSYFKFSDCIIVNQIPKINHLRCSLAHAILLSYNLFGFYLFFSPVIAFFSSSRFVVCLWCRDFGTGAAQTTHYTF